MSTALIMVFVFGVIFLLLLLIIGSIIAFRNNPTPIPNQAMLFFRVALALSASGIGAILPGFLDISGGVSKFTIQAGGALAVFLLVYLINPPNIIEERVPKPGKPVKRKRPTRTTNDPKNN